MALPQDPSTHLLAGEHLQGRVPHDAARHAALDVVGGGVAQVLALLGADHHRADHGAAVRRADRDDPAEQYSVGSQLVLDSYPSSALV